jgi:valyl-tRNA synthetase
MLQPYPQAQDGLMDVTAMQEVDWLMSFVLAVRRVRGEMTIAPAKALPILLQQGSEADQTRVMTHRRYLQRLARLESITWLESQHNPPESAMALVGTMKILIPLAGLIDKQAELERLEKEMQKIRQELPRIFGKLNNPNFIDKAPPAVVETERAKQQALESSLTDLEQQFIKIQML